MQYQSYIWVMDSLVSKLYQNVFTSVQPCIPHADIFFLKENFVFSSERATGKEESTTEVTKLFP